MLFPLPPTWYCCSRRRSSGSSAAATSPPAPAPAPALPPLLLPLSAAVVAVATAAVSARTTQRSRAAAAALNAFTAASASARLCAWQSGVRTWVQRAQVCAQVCLGAQGEECRTTFARAYVQRTSSIPKRSHHTQFEVSVSPARQSVASSSILTTHSASSLARSRTFQGRA